MTGSVQWSRASFAAGALVAACLLARGAPAADGESGEATDPTLGTIDVRAERLDEPPDTSAFVTTVPIREQPAELKTLTDVLAESVGVQVRRFGGLGDFATVSIRGSSAGQVRIFFDGVPLTRARSETVNLADLPLDQLERVEIYRGVTPLAASASALAGVINLVSRDPGPVPRFSLLAGGGSFGTRKVTVTGSARQGRLAGLVSATYLGAEGDFSFFDDNGTPENPRDDETTDRRNNAFDSAETLLKLRWALADGGTLAFVHELFGNEQGVPGIGAFQSERASLRDLRSLSYLRWETARPGGLPLETATTGFFVFERERFHDVEGEIGTGNQKTDNRTYSGGLQNHLTWFLGAHEVEARLDATGEVFSPRDELASESNGPNQSRITFDAALGDTFGVLGERLLAQPSVRYELVHDEFGGTIGAGGAVAPEPSGGDEHLLTPRLGLRLEVASWLALKGNVGRYARVPNFSELFGNRGSVIGNPELDPETGLNFDLGFVARAADLGPVERLQLESAFFYSDVDDVIVLVQNSQRTSIPRNVARAEVRGHELTVRVELPARLRLALNHTYQRATDESGIPARDGNRLPGRPENDLYLRAEWAPRGARLFYELSHLTDNFLDQANLRRVGTRTIHTIGAEARLPWGGLVASLELRNLSDDQIEDVAGFPLPGRALFGSLRWEWTGAELT